MASDAEWALGDHILMGDGATPVEAFTRIPELRNLALNFGTRTRVDTSSHDSTKPFRDNVATFLEEGTITADGNYLPHNTVHKALDAALAADEPKNFRYVIVAEDGDVVYAGKGRVTQWSPTSNFEDARRCQLQIAMTGAWPRVQGS